MGDGGSQHGQVSDDEHEAFIAHEGDNVDGEVLDDLEGEGTHNSVFLLRLHVFDMCPHAVTAAVYMTRMLQHRHARRGKQCR